MGSLLFSNPTMIMAEFKYLHHQKVRKSSLIPIFQPKFYHKNELRLSRTPVLVSPSNTQYSVEGDDPEGNYVQHLKIPSNWLDPSKASEESEWLRVTLHQWLDDEYCPEETNMKISEVASHSFYKSLVEKKTDLGEILLEMVHELGSISYQESFHGAFSSANAAIDLIIQRIQHD